MNAVSRIAISLLVALVIFSGLAAGYILSQSPPTTTTLKSKTATTITGLSTSSSSRDIPVGAFLYLWYGNSTSHQGGLGSPGWNSSSSPGGGAVVDDPVDGYYISDSNQTFSWQISQMLNAGLDFAIVSWWGPFTTGESGAINKATHDLFQYLEAARSTFQIAIIVDSYLPTQNQTTSTFQSLYNYVNDEFVTPYSQSYFNFEGKPLLLFFNPLYPTYLNSSFTVRTIGNRPNPVNWTFWDAPSQYFVGENGPHVNASYDEGNPVISSDGEVTLVPRIDSYYYATFGYSDSYLRFDPNLSMGLYQEQWSFVLDHSRNVSLVLIYSWNEYHERSSIEPHYDYTNSSVSPFYLTNLTKGYIDQLNR